jgi:predicted AAA+ superfamily ATPase
MTFWGIPTEHMDLGNILPIQFEFSIFNLYIVAGYAGGGTMVYYPRIIEQTLLDAHRHFPVVLLTGPRQSGKSTTLTRLFKKHCYVTFDDPVVRAQAIADPALFLVDHPAPVILDEIQYVPQLLPHVKMLVDKNRGQGGRFLLTGSQVFSLMEGVSESLAGRVAVLELLPLTYRELPKERTIGEDRAFSDMIRGYFPGTAAQKVSSKLFYGSYIQTYLERDLRYVQAVQDLRTFQSFVEVLATNIGQVLNLSRIGAVCGITHTTAKRWLSILEASRIVYLLRPYTRNLRKRIVKTPKLYFTDSGIVTHILRESNPRALRHGLMGGYLFENMVIMDLLKNNFAYGNPFQFYFYRDNNQMEVDLILERGGKLTPVEIKLTRSPTTQMVSGIRSLSNLMRVQRAFLVTTRNQTLSIAEGIVSKHWYAFLREFEFT